MKLTEQHRKHIRHLVEHAMMKYPGALIVHDCPKCHTRSQVNVGDIMAVENMVNLIEELASSDAFMYAVFTKINELGQEEL